MRLARVNIQGIPTNTKAANDVTSLLPVLSDDFIHVRNSLQKYHWRANTSSSQQLGAATRKVSCSSFARQRGPWQAFVGQHSTFFSTTMQCAIPSNPDIVGIGVRTAIYAQNLLSFVPAAWAIWDKQVDPYELEAVETQSTTILITAFAIIISAVIQALNSGLTNFHAIVILNLSWMNNTNTFIWFLLFAQRVDWSNWRAMLSSWLRGVMHKESDPEYLAMMPMDTEGNFTETAVSSLAQNPKKTGLRRIFRYPVLVIGSVHLTLMAALGLWLWANPDKFGSISPPCLMSTSVLVIGNKIPLANSGLRDWSMLIYSILAVPAFNLIIPMASIVTVHVLYTSHHAKPPRTQNHIPTVIGLVMLAIINIVFIADIEVMLSVNKPLQQGGDLDWTFGQTLALLLLLVPIRDSVETFLMRREKRRQNEHTDSLRNAVEMEEIGVIQGLIEKGADVNVVTSKASLKRDVLERSNQFYRRKISYCITAGSV